MPLCHPAMFLCAFVTYIIKILCYCVTVCLSKLTTQIWMKIDPYYRRQRCSAVTVVSGNIRFTRIFAGRGGSNNSVLSWQSSKTIIPSPLPSSSSLSSLFPPLSLSLPCPLRLPCPSLPCPPVPFIEVGPLNPASGSGGALWAPPVVSGAESQPKSNLVHFSFKISQLVATILMILLRTDWPNFVQFSI